LHAINYICLEPLFKTEPLELSPEEILHIIAKAKSGDQKAYRQLLDHCWNMVFGFQLKRVHNESDAEDITIEAFAKAFDKIDQFDTNYNFSSWVITISKNIQIDQYRRQRNSIVVAPLEDQEDHGNEVPDDSLTTEDALIQEQNLIQLQTLMKMLKPMYREVLQLRYFQEMPYRDMAEQLGEPLTNIKVRLLRAKKLMAELIEQNRQL
jgi:RNA polymerase sigma-70 factor (ECF subfamily)